VSLSPAKAFALAVAALAGPAVAVALAAGGGPQLPPVTIGSTTGTPPFQNICGAPCTYVPYVGVNPELQVPITGTVTSFAVNSGSAGNTVELRVLRRASGGQFSAIASSPAETLTTGPQSFSVSLPVQDGDVLALDNADSALLFDTTTSTDTAWYYSPALPNGTTAAPTNEHAGYRLLVSATILPNPTETTTTTTGTTPAPPPAPGPALSHVSQNHKTWRLGTKLATISSSRRPPVGTTFKFDLNEPAQVSFAFTQLFPGRKVSGRCVAQTSHNLHTAKCTRNGRTRAASFNAAAGADKVAFDGRISRSTKLKPGSYEVAIQARNSSGRSNTVTLKFTIAG
jgi:hypothetical protein